MAHGLATLFTEIEQQVAGILGVAADEVKAEAASTVVAADIAVPLFRFAKEKQVSPTELAQRVAIELRDARFDTVVAENGFVNISVAPVALAELIIADILNDKPYGSSEQGAGKTVVVDFIGPNLSKPYSVGHLRPAVQGAALIALYRTLGYEVVGDSHLGDWGTPFGMWVVAFEKWGNNEALEHDGVYELGRLYVKFRQEAKENPELMEEAKGWLKKLEAGNEEAVAYKERFTAISLEHLSIVLSRLKITADENLGESFYVEKSKELVTQLLEQGIATRNDDSSVIVDLTDHGIDTPILLEKSDGSVLYATTDIETIRYRVERWKPEKIIYSVGAEQQFHFKQVFALAKKLGYESELIHAWFGTVDELDEDGKRGKMSSRKSAALLENLLDTAEEQARKHITSEVSEEDIKKIALGAVKFSDFSAGRQTNILFDWDKMFSLQGFSGPYIQYAAVRIKSLLAKAGDTPTQLAEHASYSWTNEKSLLLHIAKFPGVLHMATQEYEPHRIAQHAFELAQELNRYYETVSIQDSTGEDRAARIALLALVAELFETSLGILGIEVPDKM